MSKEEVDRNKQIMTLHAIGVPQRLIAVRFGLHVSRVQKIIQAYKMKEREERRKAAESNEP